MIDPIKDLKDLCNDVNEAIEEFETKKTKVASKRLRVILSNFKNNITQIKRNLIDFDKSN